MEVEETADLKVGVSRLRMCLWPSCWIRVPWTPKLPELCTEW